MIRIEYNKIELGEKWHVMTRWIEYDENHSAFLGRLILSKTAWEDILELKALHTTYEFVEKIPL